ncbi:MAG TPA: DUF1376 domain-containing protein [Xanthobacteraceae bacterium]|jgi:uncharacterized protein YdaU (DUF1376 family)
MNPPKMPIHIGDLLRDTGHLDRGLLGSYLLLMFHHWSTGSLPDDDKLLATIARMTSAEWKRERVVLEKFFEQPGWHHGRIAKDLETSHANYEKRAKAGSEGGKAKANAKQNPSKKLALLESEASNALATDNLLPKKEDEAPEGAPSTGKIYAFESGVIRLNQQHFDQWKANFPNIDVGAELLAMTEWAGQQRSWFNAVKGALAKKNQLAKERKAAAAEQGGFKWNGIEGVL